ncbi:NADH-dependent oxidoreductase [Limosilactobacillus vaginalis]|uniref:oxidoreductase n=1 Tax=Limosilactobacillus vaginalis TaxID=1633 RepID=UPI0024BAF04B|nr:NADH-dependent oxidoreductase [Limosilactobacillus vaginalis]
MKQLTDHITFRHGATINNRLVQAPMLTNSGDNEAVSQDTLDYYGARSQSAGMVIVEYTSVRKNGGPSRSWADNREQLAIYDDRFKPGMTKVAKALKKDGNKAILQLVHSGREANYAPKLGRTVEVPSQMDFPWIDYPLHELTSEEVEQVVKDFGAATKRAIDCGFDGVEIHGANHYLIQQFFSAFSNHRTDKWGGSLEKRMNFPLAVVKEVMDVVKQYAPKDFIVGYRISPEEIHQTVGYTWHESTQLIKAITDNAELFRPAIGDKVKEIIVGNVMSEKDAQDALKLTDLVAMARATLIDPAIGLKIEEGRGDEIIRKISPEQVKKSHLTPGLINLFSDPQMEPHLPGRETIYSLHQTGSLNKDVLKNGTSSSFNLDHFKK